MAVVPRKQGSGTVYWVAFYTKERLPSGKRRQVWERSGTVEREAEALNRKRLREVKDGTYSGERSPTMTFGEFLGDWLKNRRNRNAKRDGKNATRHLLSRGWLCRMRLEDLRPRHGEQLVNELKATVSEETGKALGEKFVSNLFGLFSTALHDAQRAELITASPWTLPKKLLRRKSRKGVRINYEVPDVLALSSCPDDEAMVFSMLLILTGMREGEACGRRWRDWDQHSTPLGCLHVTTQYNDQPLKTERDEGGEHPRNVPVHPALDRLLTWWWEDGFKLTYGRPPTRDDFIVPRTPEGDNHTISSGYKLWVKAYTLSGVTNRSLHSTRHTFITLCRRGGAQKDIVEQITHNAGGDIVDQYTHMDWSPLCAAVLCLRLPTDPERRIDSNIDGDSRELVIASDGSAGGGNRSLLLPPATDGTSGNHRAYNGMPRNKLPLRRPDDSPISRRIDARRCADQELVAVPRSTQDYIAKCVRRAKRSALRRDKRATLKDLRRAAIALDGIGSGGRAS